MITARTLLMCILVMLVVAALQRSMPTIGKMVIMVMVLACMTVAAVIS